MLQALKSYTEDMNCLDYCRKSSYIPAFTFLLPYLIEVNLIRKQPQASVGYRSYK
jgi:hypothetical protein